MRRPVNILTIFRNHPVFSELPRASIEQLGAYLTKRKVQRGTTIFRKGDAGSELIVILSGIDEISGQVIHGRWAYGVYDVHWGARFADIITTHDDGVRTIDYHHFHEVVRVDGDMAAGS